MIVAVIPARFASSRLVGKPLAEIGSKPMIQHTYESVQKSKLIEDVIIAVDDEKVYNVCKGFGAAVKMTSKEISTGSDRIAAVAEQLSQNDIIVNIQGDEPFIAGKMIDQAIEPLLFDRGINISTLAKKIETVEEFKSPDIPKVVFDYNNFALYFSRSPIPHVRDARSNLERIRMADVFKHIGLYVFRRDSLLEFSKFPQTDLEGIEKLEQLRMLENGMKIKVVVTDYESFSIDTPQDLEKIRNFYQKYKEHYSKPGN